MKKLILLLAVAAVPALLLSQCSSRVNVPQMADFDAQRYLGKWYEIARLDYTFERGLDRVTAEYSLKPDGKIRVVNRGYKTSTGEWKQAEGEAELTSVPNYLKVSFSPLFESDYQIAYVDKDYNLAVVSGGNREYLWLLARTPVIKDSEKNRMLAVARRLGYDTSKLVYPQQP